jgi:protein SCO1/2
VRTLLHRDVFARALAASALALLVLAGCGKQAAAPGVLGQVPAFQLVDETGAPFDAATRLRGQVWVANFIFTRCPDICPTFTAKLALVQEKSARMKPAAPHLVSFSVDPTHDTPAVLAAYAREHGARPERWSFLTGDYGAVKAAVEDGIKVHMQETGKVGDVPTISHGSHFVLVDRALRIRGYYDMNDADAVARVLRDAESVSKETAP